MESKPIRYTVTVSSFDDQTHEGHLAEFKELHQLLWLSGAASLRYTKPSPQPLCERAMLHYDSEDGAGSPACFLHESCNPDDWSLLIDVEKLPRKLQTMSINSDGYIKLSFDYGYEAIINICKHNGRIEE